MWVFDTRIQHISNTDMYAHDADRQAHSVLWLRENAALLSPTHSQ
jgi:hypothetical protein